MITTNRILFFLILLIFLEVSCTPKLSVHPGVEISSISQVSPVLKGIETNPVLRITVNIPAGEKEITYKGISISLNPEARKTIDNLDVYFTDTLASQKLHDQVIVSFQYAGTALKTKDGKPLRGSIFGNEKGIDKDANAFIRNNKVVIPIDKNEKPVKILYGWKPYTDANLINREGLPASTFEMNIK